MTTSPDRRRHDRYELPAMYSRIAIRRLESDDFEWDGHAYDISRGGVRFELDRGFEPGTPIAMRIDLPRAMIERSTERRSVYVFANVVWLEDDDQTGPIRMAAVFSRFCQSGDEELLLKRINSGRYSLAA